MLFREKDEFVRSKSKRVKFDVKCLIIGFRDIAVTTVMPVMVLMEVY